jgi:hypothetical protein
VLAYRPVTLDDLGHRSASGKRWPLTSPDDAITDADVAAYAVVAHGLLTSASVIVGITETLLDRWDEIPDVRRRDLVAKSGEQARTIQSVLHSMVSALPAELFAPIRDAIAGQIDAQAVDVDTIVRSAAGTDASPKTSSPPSEVRPHNQR